MTDGAIHQEGIAAFVLRLRAKGIVDKALLSAFEATPRKNFIESQWQDYAWSERMLPLPCGEAIEGADTQALVLSALDLTSNARVLEIGSGSGYTAAVMSRIAARVLSLERFKTLVEQARGRMEPIGVENVLFRHADGHNGVISEGPFDRVIAWAAFDSLPRVFVDQLSSGGMMVAPIGPPDDEQMLVRLTKTGSRFEEQIVGPVRFQPMARTIAEVL